MTSTPQQRIDALILSYRKYARPQEYDGILQALRWARQVVGDDGEDHIPPVFLRRVLEKEKADA